jgi:hypothetical protein
MKAFVIASVVLVATAAVAQAQSERVRNSHAQMPHQPGKHMSVSDSTDVVVGGRVVGRDPSESVRTALYRDYFSADGAGAEVGGGGGAGAGDSGGAQ